MNIRGSGHRSKLLRTSNYLQVLLILMKSRLPNRLCFTGWHEECQSLIGYRPNRRLNADGSDAGFTLFELLIVITILGVLVAIVAPAGFKQLDTARTKTALQQIQRIESLLDLYKLDLGGYPTSEQGLMALVRRPSDSEDWAGPYLKSRSLPKDPWNHEWLYRSPSARPDQDYDLCSAGPNGKGSTPEDGRTLCNS